MTGSQIKELAHLIRQADRVVALTGAGVSTESGIPDFTSTRDGPSMLSVGALYQQPEAFYRYCLKSFSTMLKARPNATHYGLAALEQAGILEGLITQNIDGLHQAAGSKTVLELHGHLRTAHCERCFNDLPLECMLEQIEDGIIPPRHGRCGGMLIPQVVLFGDPLPPAFGEAMDLVATADLMLIIGTALVVAPANSLPHQVDNLVVINLSSTPFDHQAKLVFRNKAGEVMAALVEELRLGNVVTK